MIRSCRCNGELDRLFDDFTRRFPALSSGGAAELLPSMDVTQTDKQSTADAHLTCIKDAGASGIFPRRPSFPPASQNGTEAWRTRSLLKKP